MRLKNNIDKSVKVMVLISYLIMLATNALANILPLNGKLTADISDAYPNLFTPAGITFSIWGVIYILLFFFTLYFLGFFNKIRSRVNDEVYKRIGYLFVFSSIMNTLWLFAWHYEMLLISVFVMLALLIALIMINYTIMNERLNNREKFFVKLPFTVYFGWITVATIANITAYLSSINWLGFGLSENMWTIIILVVGMIIGVLAMLRFKALAYGLVLIWAYTGIFIKHFSINGYAGIYPMIMVTVGLCIVVFIMVEAYLIYSETY